MASKKKKRADLVPATTHNQQPSFTIDLFVEAKEIIRKYARRDHPDVDLTRGSVSPTVPWHRLDTSAASLLRRVRARLVSQ